MMYLRPEDALVLAVGIDDEAMFLFVFIVLDVTLEGPANSYNSSLIKSPTRLLYYTEILHHTAH